MWCVQICPCHDRNDISAWLDRFILLCLSCWHGVTTINLTTPVRNVFWLRRQRKQRGMENLQTHFHAASTGEFGATIALSCLFTAKPISLLSPWSWKALAKTPTARLSTNNANTQESKWGNSHHDNSTDTVLHALCAGTRFGLDKRQTVFFLFLFSNHVSLLFLHLTFKKSYVNFILHYLHITDNKKSSHSILLT